MFDNTSAKAGQFQPVIEMSVFPASPDRADAGKGRLSRLSNNSVQGVALLSMLGLAACSSDTGVYLNGGGGLPGGGSNIDLGGGGSGTFTDDASGVSVTGGIVRIDVSTQQIDDALNSETAVIEAEAAADAAVAAEQITQGISNLNYAPSIDGQNTAAQFRPSSNLHQSQAGYDVLPGGKAKGSYKNDAGETVKVEYIQHPVLTALLEQPVDTNGVNPTAVNAPYFDVDLSTISAGVAAVQDGTAIDEIGFMVSFAHYSISSPYDPYILPTPIYRPDSDVRQADVDPANKLGADVRNIDGSANPDFIRGNDSANEIDGGAGADNLHGGVGDDTLYGGPGNDNLSGDLGNDILNGGDGTDIARWEIRNPGAPVYDASHDDTANTLGALDGFNLNSLPQSIQDIGTNPALQAAKLGIGQMHLVAYLVDGNGAAHYVTPTPVYNADGTRQTETTLLPLSARQSAFRKLVKDGDYSYDDHFQNFFIVGTNTGNPVSDADKASANIPDTVTGVVYWKNRLLHQDFVVNDYHVKTDTLVAIENLGIKYTAFPGAKTLLIGDDNNNEINGRDSTDILIGGGGADRLRGADGKDYLDGGAGADTLWGGRGNDKLWGSGGGDELRGGDGDDELRGGAGIDTLRGGANADKLYGGAEGDILYGNGGYDMLEGGEGNDTLEGGGGSDRLTGGDDNDIFIINTADKNNNTDTITDFSLSDDVLKIQGLGGTKSDGSAPTTDAEYLASLGLDWGTTADGHLALVHTDGTVYAILEGLGDSDKDNVTFDWTEVEIGLLGTTGNDSLSVPGNSINNAFGLGGNDEINGNDSNNTLYGGEGDDTLDGGGGNDTLYGGADADIFYLDMNTAWYQETNIIKDFSITDGDRVKITIADRDNVDSNDSVRLFDDGNAYFVAASAKLNLKLLFLDGQSGELRDDRQTIDAFYFEGYENNYDDLQEYLKNGGGLEIV